MEDDNNVIVCLQTYPPRWLRMCSCRTCLWRWPRSGSHLRLHPPLWWCSSRKCRSDRERGWGWRWCDRNTHNLMNTRAHTHVHAQIWSTCSQTRAQNTQTTKPAATLHRSQSAKTTSYCIFQDVLFSAVWYDYFRVLCFHQVQEHSCH